MGINIDTTMAFPNVQENNSIGAGIRVQSPKGPYKTNPLAPDSFRKPPVVLTPYNQMDRLYQKLLEKVAPNVLLDAYLSENAVTKMIENNPNIMNILKKHNVPLTINLDNVKDIKKEHLYSTESFARGIASEMNLSQAEKDTICRGALFHDFGKILIPAELLNKKGKLTAEEKKIVDLHSTLGYELLKTTNLSPEVLEIVKNHHKPLNKNPDLKTQIVSVADIYSALRTERSYKQTLSQEQSLNILRKYSEMGQVDPQIIEALTEHVKIPDLTLV